MAKSRHFTRLFSNIAGSALALHCCKAHAKINLKMGKSKLCIHDYVVEDSSLPAMHILVSIGTVGASSQIGEILPPCDFFDCAVLSCPYLFSLDPTPRSNRWTDFHDLWLKGRVSAQGWFFWGL